MTRYYAKADNTYWGGYDGPDSAGAVPAGAIEVPLPPPGPHHLWDGSTWQMDGAAAETAKDGDAGLALNTALNKALRDILLNLEARLVAAGVTADAAGIPAAVRQPGIAAATDQAQYTAALKAILKAYL